MTKSYKCVTISDIKKKRGLKIEKISKKYEFEINVAYIAVGIISLLLYIAKIYM